MICITCEHDCHCDDKCDALPMDGGCGCLNCVHEIKKVENMFKKIWKKNSRVVVEVNANTRFLTSYDNMGVCKYHPE